MSRAEQLQRYLCARLSFLYKRLVIFLSYFVFVRNKRKLFDFFMPFYSIISVCRLRGIVLYNSNDRRITPNTRHGPQLFSTKFMIVGLVEYPHVVHMGPISHRVHGLTIQLLYEKNPQTYTLLPHESNNSIRSQFCAYHDSWCIMSWYVHICDLSWITRIIFTTKRISQDFNYELINRCEMISWSDWKWAGDWPVWSRQGKRLQTPDQDRYDLLRQVLTPHRHFESFPFLKSPKWQSGRCSWDNRVVNNFNRSVISFSSVFLWVRTKYFSVFSDWFRSYDQQSQGTCPHQDPVTKQLPGCHHKSVELMRQFDLVSECLPISQPAHIPRAAPPS